MTVRAAVAVDVARVHAIATANATAPQWTSAQFAEILSPPESAVTRVLLVAEIGGEISGFAVVSALTAVYPVEAELESIAVAPERQRHGMGRSLMRAVLAWCEDAGVSEVRLEVRASNARAIGLYTAYGFRKTGTRRRYYVNPTEDAVCMMQRMDAADM